ncbi:MAG TPA: Gldg family protein [Stellaceae bacterium]|nr:Gldg family protein [Stellaceae bacterium]
MIAAFFASRQRVAVAALVLVAVILVSVNVLAARFSAARLDLTQGRLYTLSSGTRRTLAKIDEPITLRFYYSTELGDRLPPYGVYAERVRELLEQYAAAAHGKLRLEIYHPQPFSRVEDQAVAFGLQGVPLDQQGDQVYFGLAGTNSTDDQQVIPFFSPQREHFLEYDLTKLVHNLVFPKKPVIGLITTLPLEGNVMAMMRGEPSQPMAVVSEIEQLDEVKPLPGEPAQIPADVDVLMIVHPQKLPPKTLYAIDQFVLKGGKALVFVDPYSELEAALRNRPNMPGGPSGSDLEPLFKSWGIRMLPRLVAADRRDAERVNVPVPGRGEATLAYVAWLGLGPENLNRKDPITADLHHLTLASAGILEKRKGAATTVEPLVTTSPDSMQIPVGKVQGLPDVAGLLDDFKASGRRYILAARITGIAKTAFPKGPPPEQPAKQSKPGAPQTAAPPPGLQQSARPINVVVVADSDLLADRFWVRPQNFFGRRVLVPVADNGDFVLNALGVLAGGDDLIGLRSRGTSARPFVLVDRIRRAADERYSAEERRLQQKLKLTEAKLQNVTAGQNADAAVTLSPKQTQAMAQFRADILQTRRQLRAVERALRADIARLKGMLEFFDIALVPILVAAVAIVLGIVRLRRRRRRASEA